MNGTEVKSGADIQFAIKSEDADKSAVAGAKENAANDDMTLRGFSFWSFVAGVLGLVAWYFAEIAAVWNPALFLCSALLILYGGILFWHTGQYNKALLYMYKTDLDTKEKIAQAARDLQAEKDTSHKNTANAERRHNAHLAKVKTAEEKLRADMRKEMEARESAAAQKYKHLQNEKAQMESEKEKLALTLSGARETLAYYSGQDRLDVYTGEDAVRQCGGIYVISNANEGKVKIGMTAGDMSRRLTELRASCFSAGTKKEDIKPEVLVPLDEYVYEVEQEIHRTLADRRIAGEWFQIAPADAVAVVLEHVRKKRMHNFKVRAKLRIEKGGKE